MDAPTEEFYNNEHETEILVLFDHRGSGGITRLWRERRAWGSRARFEILGSGYSVLFIRPGGAEEIAR